MREQLLIFIRPYHGLNINGDMGGDLGIVDPSGQLVPDTSFVYGASLAHEYEVETIVLDLNAEEQFFTDRLLANIEVSSRNPTVFLKIGAPTWREDFVVASRIKKILPRATILICGLLPALFAYEIQNNYGWIDGVVTGDLERAVLEIVSGAGSSSSAISWSSERGSPHIKKGRIDLRLLSVPHYELFPHDKYRDSSGRKLLYTFGSRGCIYRCSYCPYIIEHPAVAQRPIEDVARDVEYILSTVGADRIQFRDALFTYDSMRTSKLCRLLGKVVAGTLWYCETRIELLSSALLSEMRVAGCELIAFGVESASLTNLKNVKRSKPVNEHIRNMLATMKELGIKSHAFYIVGFPHDDLQSIRDTFEMACELDTDSAQFNVLAPYPGTALWTQFAANFQASMHIFEPDSNNTVLINPQFSIENLIKISANLNLSYPWRQLQDDLTNA